MDSCLHKMNISILHGSSCVGKSTLMHRADTSLDMVEMDDSGFWKVNKSEWPRHCFAYLVERITANVERKDMIVTCGGLPLPNDPMYSKITQQYNVTLEHTLVLVRNIDDYRRNIVKRGLEVRMQELFKSYAWRETTIALHDKVVYNIIL